MRDREWVKQRGYNDKQGLLDLFHNRCAYIMVENFLTPLECSDLIEALRHFGLKQYPYNFAHHDAPPASQLFEQHYLYEPKRPAEYFPKAAQSITQYHELVKMAKLDPAAKVFDYFKELNLPVQIAAQDGQPYSYIMARELNHTALLHADFAPFIPPYWSITKVIAQYAWNIYLSDPWQGGECVVYNRFWQQADDHYIIRNTYGYDHQVVAGCEQIKIHPEPGMLLIFNSRNFHEVLKSEKPRLSMGGHMGLLPDNQIIAWV